MSWKTWTLFQSPEAKAIYAHLSVQEYRNYQKITTGFAIRNGIISGIFAIGFQQPYIAIKVLALTMLALHVFNQTSLLDELKQFLCSTEWAKEQGYEPDTLKLYSFQSSYIGRNL